MEVLYEDPKEDSVSILSSEDGGVAANTSASAATASMPALAVPTSEVTEVTPACDLDRRKDTLKSWQGLEEEIRDLHELITEFSAFVVTVGVRN